MLNVQQRLKVTIKPLCDVELSVSIHPTQARDTTSHQGRANVQRRPMKEPSPLPQAMFPTSIEVTSSLEPQCTTATTRSKQDASKHPHRATQSHQPPPINIKTTLASTPNHASQPHHPTAPSCLQPHPHNSPITYVRSETRSTPSTALRLTRLRPQPTRGPNQTTPKPPGGLPTPHHPLPLIADNINAASCSFLSCSSGHPQGDCGSAGDCCC